MSGIADEDHLEWDDAASQEWFEIVESWRWERREGDWVKQGQCPRCGHSMDRTFAGGIAFALPQLPGPVAIWCNCSAPHANRPDGRNGGCGSSARISAPDPMSGDIGPGGVTEDDIRWEQEAIDAQHQSLSRVRATAAAWSSSIAALLGVFSIVAFIKGPSTVSSLSHTTATVVTILVLVAALLAAGATLTAAVAAQGTPRWLNRLDGQALRATNRDAAKKVVLQLWISRILALLAAICVLAGMSTAWLSISSQAQPSQRAIVVMRTGEVRCGTLGATANHGVGLLVDGESLVTPLVNVNELVRVKQCP